MLSIRLYLQTNVKIKLNKTIFRVEMSTGLAEWIIDDICLFSDIFMSRFRSIIDIYSSKRREQIANSCYFVDKKYLKAIAVRNSRIKLLEMSNFQKGQVLFKENCTVILKSISNILIFNLLMKWNYCKGPIRCCIELFFSGKFHPNPNPFGFNQDYKEGTEITSFSLASNSAFQRSTFFLLPISSFTFCNISIAERIFAILKCWVVALSPCLVYILGIVTTGFLILQYKCILSYMKIYVVLQEQTDLPWLLIVQSQTKDWKKQQMNN